MRAVVITAHGDPSVLKVQDRPDPGLGPGQVRVDVKAAGLNFADVMARMGLYPDAPKPPAVVGYQVAGGVAEAGEGGGARAAGGRALAGPRSGRWAEEAGVPAGGPIALQEALSYGQDGAVP